MTSIADLIIVEPRDLYWGIQAEWNTVLSVAQLGLFDERGRIASPEQETSRSGNPITVDPTDSQYMGGLKPQIQDFSQ